MFGNPVCEQLDYLWRYSMNSNATSRLNVVWAASGGLLAVLGWGTAEMIAPMIPSNATSLRVIVNDLDLVFMASPERSRHYTYVERSVFDSTLTRLIIRTV